MSLVETLEIAITINEEGEGLKELHLIVYEDDTLVVKFVLLGIIFLVNVEMMRIKQICWKNFK